MFYLWVSQVFPWRAREWIFFGFVGHMWSLSHIRPFKNNSLIMKKKNTFWNHSLHKNRRQAKFGQWAVWFVYLIEDTALSSIKRPNAAQCDVTFMFLSSWIRNRVNNHLSVPRTEGLPRTWSFSAKSRQFSGQLGSLATLINSSNGGRKNLKEGGQKKAVASSDWKGRWGWEGGGGSYKAGGIGSL